MRTSSIEDMQQVDNATRQDSMPTWMDNFLKQFFFDKCPIHGSSKNSLNRYCITCDASTCKDCITLSHHPEHQILTIYRHVYRDVVPLSQMQNYFDCMDIQHYKNNKKLVVSLTPLPHNGSGALIVGDGACCSCKRKLTDPVQFRFCSIGCKVQTIFEGIGRIPPRARGVDTSHGDERVEQPASERDRKRSRKGTPHRAN